MTSSPFLLNAITQKHKYQYITTDPDYVQKNLLSFFIHDFTRGELSNDTVFELYKKFDTYNYIKS